jgi:hypothetical protein
VSDATPAQMQTFLAAEFDRQGWQYDLDLGPALITEIEKRGSVEPEALADAVPATFLQRNRTTRENLAAAIARAIGDRTPVQRKEVATLVFQDQSHNVTISGNAQVHGSNFNLGDGTQFNVSVGGQREDVLAALAALLSAGFGGEWNEEAAAGLAQVIQARDDIDLDDVRETTAEVVKLEEPPASRAREMMEKIATAGLGGAFGTGITAVLGQLSANPPL